MAVKDDATYKGNCPLCGGIVRAKSAIVMGVLTSKSAKAPLYVKWQCQNCGAEFEATLDDNLQPERLEILTEDENPELDPGYPGNFII